MSYLKCICILSLSANPPNHRLRGRISLTQVRCSLPVRWSWSLSLLWWWCWWWWRWWATDWFVPAGTIFVHRIKYALSNEIYFLLLGSIIMLESIFNILGSILREIFILHWFCQYSRVIMWKSERLRKRPILGLYCICANREYFYSLIFSDSHVIYFLFQ